MVRYKEGCLDRSQVMLFGLSVDESVPADSDVRIVNDAIDTMDLSCLEAGYSSMGCRPYSPRVLARESELIERIFEEAEQIDAREDEMYGSSSRSSATSSRTCSFAGWDCTAYLVREPSCG